MTSMSFYVDIAIVVYVLQEEHLRSIEDVEAVNGFYREYIAYNRTYSTELKSYGLYVHQHLESNLYI
jgi:hypothetical protein